MIRFTLAILLLSAFSSSQAELRLPENEHACFIVPTRVADVGSPVRGVVERLLVDRGDTVIKGQPIAELYSGNERIMVAHAQARAQMQSELSAREADLKLANLELARIEDMHQQDLAPTPQRDAAGVRKQVAQAGVAQALENQKLVQIELQRAHHDLAQRTLRSPMNGVVVEQLIFPGEFIYDEPIMSIAALDPLRVEVVLPAEYFGSVQWGSQTLIYPELDKDNPISATVDAVDALLDTRSGTFGVRLSLPNKDQGITAGQKCSVDFLSGTNTLELAEEAE
jgi:RND family efflux transporter MFP subunit